MSTVFGFLNALPGILFLLAFCFAAYTCTLPTPPPPARYVIFVGNSVIATGHYAHSYRVAGDFLIYEAADGRQQTVNLSQVTSIDDTASAKDSK